MQASAKVRAARKEMQIARLKAKTEDPENYSEYYANQPLQKVRAAKAEEIKAARRALRDAQEDLAVAEITGEGLRAAQESHAVAALVVHKLSVPGANPGANLSAG
jgi:ERCC4-related helicase